MSQNKLKMLLIDIETAPSTVFAWGLFNQNIGINQIVEPGYTLCFSAKWYDSDDVIFYSGFHDGEDVMIRKAHDLLSEADAVIHFNGARFDIPILHKEFILQGMGPPEPFKQIDLLRTVRHQFKFASNKLDYVCQQLGIGGKVEHKGMGLWKECMAGNKDSWEVMKEYNIRDTTLLQDLYNLLLPWIKTHPNHALYTNTDRPVCTNCGSHRVVSKGVEHTNTQSYKRFKCKDCGTPLRSRFTILDKEKKQHILTQVK